MHDLHPAMVYLEGGSALFAAETLPPDKQQRTRHIAQAQLVVEALAAMKPGAMNVGRLDLTNGVEFLLQAQEQTGLPLVSANIELTDGEAAFATTRVIDWGGARLGVFGLTVPRAGRDEKLGIVVRDPLQAARAAVAQLGDVDFIVCLSDMGYDAEHTLAKEVAGIDAIVGGGKGQRLLRSPLRFGDTLLLRAADRGRFMGKVEVSRKDLGNNWKMPLDLNRVAQMERQQVSLQTRIDQAEPGPERDALARSLEAQKRLTDNPDATAARYKHQIISLSAQITDDPATAKKVAAFLRNYPPAKKTKASTKRSSPNSRTTQGRRAATYSPSPAAQWKPVDGPPRHVGSTVCRRCHSEAYRAWLATGHFRARSRVPVKEQNDPRCLPCHATRLEMAKSNSWEPTVACETCHGRGSAHRDATDMNRAVAKDVCAKCHTGFHQEEPFEFKKAYEKIRCDREGVGR